MKCGYCSIKYNERDNRENRIKLTHEGYENISMCINKYNQIVLRGYGDDCTEDLVIKYCPFCGRRLNIDGVDLINKSLEERK